MSKVREIPVRDANGDELTVYEFQDWRYLSKVRRLKLCTGETVEAAGDGFVVSATGERLTRIETMPEARSDESAS